jgi:hypothetical protein
MGAIHRFPKAAGLVPEPRPAQVLKRFDRRESADLLKIARRLSESIEVLVEFVDAHRDVSNQAGIETLAIEMGSEKTALGEILDTLEDTVSREEPGEISLEGLALLRRLEKLVAEANSNISRFVSGSPSPRMSGASATPDSSDSFLWGSVVFFGIFAVAVVVIGLASSAK